MKRINTLANIDIKRVREIFKNFTGKRIAVVGDIMLDEYYWGAVSRISPEAPVPVVKYISKSDILGGASNVANNIFTLGGNPFLIGAAGEDNYGDVLTSLIAARGIDTSGIVIDPTRPTTVKTRIMAHNQQMLRIDREDSTPIKIAVRKQIIEKIKKNIKNIDAVLISDYAKGVITGELLDELIPLLNKYNKFIAVDPKVKHFFKYKNVSILTPNNHEAGQAVGIEITDEKSLLFACEKIMKKLKCKSLLVTQGEKGMTLFEGRGKFTHIPTVAQHVYDVTGAGDSVISTLVLAVSAGADSLEAAYISNHAAGIVVE
ncbi:D-glycero-beta-D-manno-heptose-7-phosphate kinase [Candidatus Desantisbacteria bacterium]|nr:D-glycero-beta-D-manno-heptose-7-phosphate kinase [Candidatus Desantisbacteria bacterium]